jgi:pyruvate formate lyase activating enzyme
MLGCDFHCGYCQNWLTSQALRDETAGVMPTDMTPDALVALALRQGARMVGSSYNEPLITAEWAVDVFKVARPQGLRTAFISNGNATPEVLDYIRPWTDCYKIDLKAMDDKRYRELGGVLQHVLDAIRMVHERGFWLEIVTLIVPGSTTMNRSSRARPGAIASVAGDSLARDGVPQGLQDDRPRRHARHNPRTGVRDRGAGRVTVRLRRQSARARRALGAHLLP